MPTVNPDILSWARETAGYDLEDAARKLQIHDGKRATAIEKLAAYESGQVPSRSLLMRMAKQYRRPLLLFYMKELPRVADRGEDYRTLTFDADPSQDGIIDALVRDIKARQSIVREALITEGGVEEIPFIGSLSMDVGIRAVVNAIQEAADIDLEQYRSKPDQDAAFKYLRSQIEGMGIFTILAGNLGSYHTNLDSDVFRGFALADEIAPFVVVNDQDSRTAWSFTLLHEVTHLWLGATGISGGTGVIAIERFCNDVASELLLPDVETMWITDAADFESLVSEIDSFAGARKVSSRMVAYRLFRQGSIPEVTYDELGAFFYSRWQNTRGRRRKRQRESDDGGPSYYVIKRFRLGDALLSVTERMLSSGELSTTKVGTVLGVRALNVGSMFDRVA